jgi:hypothetical protein
MKQLIKAPERLKGKNSFSASAKITPNRRAVYSKALGISRYFSLLCLFWKSPRFCAVGRNEAVVGGSR